MITNESYCSVLSSGYSNCDQERWSFQGLAFDLESGMSKINIDYSGEDADLNITGFEIGTTEGIEFDFHASCCIRKAVVSFIDVAGNGNFTEVDQGPLLGKSKI